LLLLFLRQYLQSKKIQTGEKIINPKLLVTPVVWPQAHPLELSFSSLMTPSRKMAPAQPCVSPLCLFEMGASAAWIGEKMQTV
jgi:hypothetical protein